MRFRIAAVLPLLALFASILGCASDGIETSVTFDPLAQFPAQATFLWDDARNRQPANERIAALGLGPIIKAAVEAEFALRGYRLSTSGTPDYLVSYEVASHSWIGADNSRAVGSISILLTEGSTGRRVWLGFGQSNVDVSRSPAEREARMRDAMARMLKDFPPNQGGR